jgi:hypothetical protein
MSRKSIIMGGAMLGSWGGGYLATVLGADAISFASVLLGCAGGILGIWLAYRFSS